MGKRRPKGTGGVYRPGGDGVWWISYRTGPRGARRRVRESAHTRIKGEAEALLRSRLGAVDRGQFGDSLRTTIGDLELLVANDYAENKRRTGREVTRAFARLREHFGGETKASAVTASAVASYKAARRAAGIRNATINLELAQLRRGLRLAMRLGRLTARAEFSLLRPDRPRAGFLEPAQFDAIRAKLPAELQPLVTFLYWTGWRKSEATRLEWRMVDRGAGVIRIEETKNDEPRTIPYSALPILREVIDVQRANTDTVERRLGRIVPWVFHRQGEPVLAFAAAWESACRRAGLPGRLVHDMRRSAARNMIRAGISQSVAMAIGGWKTDSVFKRYAIVDEKLIAEGLAKLSGPGASAVRP